MKKPVSYEPLYQSSHRLRRLILCSSAALRLVVAVVVIVLAGCDATPEPEAFPAVSEQIPLRIVSLSPEVSRILRELGVGGQILATDTVSGGLSGITDAIDLGAPDAAAAALLPTLRPDIVIGLANQRTRPFAMALEAKGIHVTLLEPRDANAVDAAVHQIGSLVGREMRAQILAARIAREISQIAIRRDGKSRLRIAWVIGCNPLTVVGGAGLVHETLELAGAENVFHEPNFVRRILSESELVERAPEIVLDSRGAVPASACFDAADWGARALAIPPRLATLPSVDLLTRVQDLYKILYPSPSSRNRNRPADADRGQQNPTP